MTVQSTRWSQYDSFVMDLALFGKWSFLVTIFTPNLYDVISIVQPRHPNVAMLLASRNPHILYCYVSM